MRLQKKKIDIYSRSGVSINILRLYLPLDVQKYFSWVKLPTTDFRTVTTKNLRNPRDRAPLSQDALLPSRRPGSSKPD